MTTALDMVNRVAKTAKILAAGETLEAEDAQDILKSLNEMLHGWELEGIALGHTDMALTDEVYLPDSHLKAIRWNLALEISGEYETDVNPIHIGFAEAGKRMLQAYYSSPGELKVPDNLRLIGQEYRRGWKGVISG